MSRNSLLVLFTSLLELLALGKTLDPRIVGGHDANISDYPYQVSIQYFGRHGCGGSIINENFILTAAHCTYDVTESDLSVRVGSSYRNNDGTIYGVAKIHTHPDFDDQTYDYDIALLKLTTSLVFKTGVKSITLASKGTIVNSGLPAVATGWGLTADPTQGGLPSDQLQMVVVPTISTEDCRRYYSEDNVTDRMFCAGYSEGGKDTCQGDSGGPLVVSGILLGITSWGEVCAAANSPGVYTKIPYFIDYINEVLAS